MKNEIETLQSEATMEMVDLLVKYGFKVGDAVKISDNFWNKHKKKLKEVL